MNMGRWTLVVPGKPVPCGRPRVSSGGHAYMPEATRKYERRVRRMASGVFGAPLQGKVRVRVLFVLPDRIRRDVDNLLKSVMDGLNGIAFEDDSQVVSSTVGKVVRRGQGKAVVVVETLGDGWEEEELWAMAEEAA